MSSEPDRLPDTIADLPLIRIASDLSAMAWEQMVAWRSSLGAHLDASVVDTKTSPNDLVTLADAQIESLVRGYLARVRPADLMVGEEGAAAIDPVGFFAPEFLRKLNCFDRTSGRLRDLSDDGPRLEWHVDPIDGTVNYVRNIEHYAFSVGVCEAGEGEGAEGGSSAGGELSAEDEPSAEGGPSAEVGPGGEPRGGVSAESEHRVGRGEGRWRIGLVASPGLNATWLAAEGCGAYRVEGRLSDCFAVQASPSVSTFESSAINIRARRLRGTPAGLSGRLLATGFAYVGENREPQLAKLFMLMDGYDDIRRCGSAALDLCMLAEGKVNSYAERGLGIYDYAGGALIAEQSGAFVHRGGSGGATAAAESEQEVKRLIAAI